MVSKSIGEKYIDFLQLFKASRGADLSQEIEALFAPTLKKVVNSCEISKNRTETFKQMNAVKEDYGIQSILVHEYLEAADKRKCAIRWEISYADGDIESVITIISTNQEGLIEEVNEVFGQKNSYEWPTH